MAKELLFLDSSGCFFSQAGAGDITKVGDAILMLERASAPSASAGEGVLYVQNDAPSTLCFVDDTGATLDISALASAGGGPPPGAISAYGATSAPTGWLVCDGSAVSRTTFADLFAIIGTSFGVGNGSTTFNLPDLRGSFPVGQDGGTFSSLAGTGGAESVSLSIANSASHFHTLGAGTDGVVNKTGGFGGEAFSFGGDLFLTETSTGSSGSGTAHENLPPYLVIVYIIKT